MKALSGDGVHCHCAGSAVADDGRDGGSVDSEHREAEFSVNQEIIEHDVDDVRRDIEPHGYFGVAYSPQEGRYGDREGRGDESGHQYAEIAACRLDGVASCSHEHDHLPREYHSGHGEDRRDDNGEQYGLRRDEVGVLFVVLSLETRDECRCAHVERDKYRKHDEPRLGSQSHRRNGIRTEFSDHDSIRQLRQRSQNQLRHGGCRDRQHRFVQCCNFHE